MPYTNLLRFSTQLDRSSWTKTGCSAVFLPDGTSPTTRASRFVTAAPVGGAQKITQLVGSVYRQGPIPYTLDLYTKGEDFAGQNIRVGMIQADGAAIYAQFNPTTGVLVAGNTLTPNGASGNWSGFSHSINTTGLGAGWYRYALTATPPGASGYDDLTVSIATSSNVVTAGKAFLIGGSQLAAGTGGLPFVMTQGRIAQSETLEEFDFSYHRVSSEYPDNSVRSAYGKGWVFASKEVAPPQRKFTLSFETMVYRMTSNGLRDIAAEYKLNAGRLEEFYLRHQLSSAFFYDHPYWGRLKVRFATPLVMPEGIPGGGGAIKPFQVALLELPYTPPPVFQT